MAAVAPKISIIMATLNRAAVIERALASVFSQTYQNYELIIIDGGSTDGTVEILKRHAERIAYWLSEPDHGLYHAFNKGLARATGDWIYFLGSDDYLWDPTVLETMARHLSGAFPPYRVVYGLSTMLENGRPVLVLGQPWELEAQDMAAMSLHHQSVFQHRSLFAVHGGFNEELYIAADYELLLRELKSAPALFVPDVMVSGCDVGGISTVLRNRMEVITQRRIAQKMHNLQPSRLGLVSWVNYHLYYLVLALFGRETGARYLRLLAAIRPPRRLYG